MTGNSMPYSGTNIYCGIAGWSYQDWNDYVYPPGIKDKLHYIARYVDAIEINSTFYRPPSERNSASWRERTADLPGFFFTAKVHQDVTHKGRIDKPLVKAFHDGLKPITEQNKLKHLLAQFRYDFADTPDNRKYLLTIKGEFGDISNLTLELRHNSWQSPGALEFLDRENVTVANLDYPLTHNSFSLRQCLVGKHAYLRLHGRNQKAWFSREAGRDQTYNYLYPERELEQIARRAVELAKNSRTLTLIANNHYRGKEAVTSLQLKSMLTGKKVDVPKRLAERYPELEKISGN